MFLIKRLNSFLTIKAGTFLRIFYLQFHLLLAEQNLQFLKSRSVLLILYQDALSAKNLSVFFSDLALFFIGFAIFKELYFSFINGMCVKLIIEQAIR